MTPKQMTYDFGGNRQANATAMAGTWDGTIQPMYAMSTSDDRQTARGFIKQARAIPGSIKYSASTLS